ncbi:MAG: LysR family transcriptional regulator [Pyramidobacter sp.]|nr:LysR family transcriptional regulator [Pyramidobacter sp.]
MSSLDICRYLLTVAQTRNITKAAQLLHISQPALTKAIHKRERELGVEFFDRRSSPLALTYAGERYLKNAQKLLDIDAELRQEMDAIARGAAEHVRLGISVERGTAWLPLILPAYAARHPDVKISVVEGTSESFERDLLAGTLDLCVGTLPVESEDIVCETVGESPVYLVSSPSHPFAREADLSVNSLLKPQFIAPERLRGEKFLTLQPQQGMFRTAQQIFEKYAVSVDVVMQLTSQSTVTLLAASGMGLAFTTYAGGLKALSTPGICPVFYTVENPMFCRKDTIATRKDRVFSPAVLDLIALTRTTLRAAPRPRVEVQG